jgi:DNA polymerase-3 subunit delta
MKLVGAAAARFCARPDRTTVGALIHGADAATVAARREALLAALLGPGAAAEMRLEALPAASLRADPAALDAALRAQGFFPGPRAVVVGEATDAQAETLLAALAEAARPDAFLLVCAGELKAKSTLRQGFEAHPRAAAMACEIVAPDRAAIESALSQAGVRAATAEAVAALEELGRELDSGELRQLIAVIALHHGDDPAPLPPETVAACAPPDPGAETDAALAAAAEGRPAELRLLLARLASGGTGGVGLAIAALRHFRMLHRLAAEAGGEGWESAAARLRPPLFGARRDAAIRQARRWTPAALEGAIAALLEADAAARGGSAGPAAAMVERALMRLALRGDR